MKKVLIGVVILAAAVTGYSFYADAYNPIKEKGMQSVERKADTGAADINANKQAKAQVELEAWKKLSRDEKLALIEKRHTEKLKEEAEKWANKSADKKLEGYEKKLTRRTLPKDEQEKIKRAKLEEKCKDVLPGAKDKDDDKDD